MNFRRIKSCPQNHRRGPRIAPESRKTMFGCAPKPDFRFSIIKSKYFVTKFKVSNLLEICIFHGFEPFWSYSKQFLLKMFRKADFLEKSWKSLKKCLKMLQNMFFVNKTSFATKIFIIMIVIEVKVIFCRGGNNFHFFTVNKRGTNSKKFEKLWSHLEYR